MCFMIFKPRSVLDILNCTIFITPVLFSYILHCYDFNPTIIIQNTTLSTCVFVFFVDVTLT